MCFALLFLKGMVVRWSVNWIWLGGIVYTNRHRGIFIKVQGDRYVKAAGIAQNQHLLFIQSNSSALQSSLLSCRLCRIPSIGGYPLLCSLGCNIFEIAYMLKQLLFYPRVKFEPPCIFYWSLRWGDLHVQRKTALHICDVKHDYWLFKSVFVELWWQPLACFDKCDLWGFSNK